MSVVHGRHTILKLAAKDLSVYTTTSQLEKSADSHDITTYLQDAHVFSGGLLNGTASASGIYDSVATVGPRAVIDPLVGQVVTLLRQVEGAGSGKPQDLVQVLVLKYTETNPVADMVTWAVDLQLSGLIDSTPQ